MMLRRRSNMIIIKGNYEYYFGNENNIFTEVLKYKRNQVMNRRIGMVS